MTVNIVIQSAHLKQVEKQKLMATHLHEKEKPPMSIYPQSSINGGAELERRIENSGLSEKQQLCLAAEEKLREWRNHTPVFSSCFVQIPGDALNCFYDCFENSLQEILRELYSEAFKTTRLDSNEERELQDQMEKKYGYGGSEIDLSLDSEFRRIYRVDLEIEEALELRRKQSFQGQEEAVSFIKELLAIDFSRKIPIDSFAFECISYLAEQYKAFGGFDNQTKGWRIEFSPNWEEGVLRLIKDRLWEQLIDHGYLPKLWQFPANHSNAIYSEIFTSSYAAVFKFVGKLIDFVNRHDSQELSRAYPIPDFWF